MSFLKSYGVAVGQLGVAPAEFREMTPRELMAAAKEHRRIEQAADYRAGVLAALTFNANRKKGVRAHGPRDFFPGLPAPKGPEPMEPDELWEALSKWAKGDPRVRFVEA